MRRTVAIAVALLLATTAGACSGGSKGSATALCKVISSGTFADVFQRGLDPTDTDRATAQLKAAAVDLGQLHDAAPGEVRAAVQDEIAYVDAVLKVLHDTDPGNPAAVVKAINALTRQRAAAQSASTELRAFQDAHCTTGPTAVTTAVTTATTG